MPHTPRFHPELPLLRRELTEQAARPTTYALRVTLGAALFGVAGLWLFDRTAGGGRDVTILGAGDALLDALATAAEAAIALLVPVYAAGAVASERERRTLSVLLTTELSAGQILAEKLLGRIAPVLSLFLVGLPLAAVVYGLGGVTPVGLGGRTAALVASAVAVASLTLWASVVAPTTRLATAVAYAAALPVWLAPRLADGLFGGAPWLPDLAARVAIAAVGLAGARWSLTRGHVVPLEPLRLTPASRPDAPRRPEERLAAGPTGVGDRARMLGNTPVLWRELYNRRLGLAWYVNRCGLALAGGAILAACGGMPLHAMTAVWLAAVAAVSVSAATPVAAERTAGTLDLLLATPLPGHAIFEEKLARAWRWAGLWAVAIATVAVVRAVAIVVVPGPAPLLARVLTVAVAIGVGLPFAAWVSAWVGIRRASRLRAATAALLVVGLWAGVPTAAALLPAPGGATHLVSLLSPGGLLLQPLHSASVWAGILVNCLLGGAVTWYARWRCLKHADAYLGRAGGRRRGSR